MECCVKRDIIFLAMISKHYIMLFSHRTSSMVVKFGVKWPTVLIKKIFKLQNRALRIISFSDFKADSNPLYTNLKILKLRDQIVLQNCIFVHDSLNNVSPKCFTDYFKHTRNNHSLNTRTASRGCLFVSHSGTIRYGICSITNKCISNWNGVSKILQLDLLTLTRHQLKTKLTKHLIES